MPRISLAYAVHFVGICHGYRWQMPCISPIDVMRHACLSLSAASHVKSVTAIGEVLGDGASVSKNTYQMNGYEVEDAFTSADEISEDSAASDFTAPSRFLLW